MAVYVDQARRNSIRLDRVPGRAGPKSTRPGGTRRGSRTATRRWRPSSSASRTTAFTDCCATCNSAASTDNCTGTLTRRSQLIKHQDDAWKCDRENLWDPNVARDVRLVGCAFDVQAPINNRNYMIFYTLEKLLQGLLHGPDRRVLGLGESAGLAARIDLSL